MPASSITRPEPCPVGCGTQVGQTDFGIYVHVPFCTSRCDYCAFVTFTDHHELMGAYVDACVSELRHAREAGELRPATSLYLGGGTPSLLPPPDLERLVGAVELAPSAEVTVECNPESTTLPLLSCLISVGVSRVSLGAQSLVPHVLRSLGRTHTAGSLERSVELVAESGFASYNLDLIFGATSETDEDFLATLEGVLDLEPRPPHVSAYALSVEPGTPLALDRSRHPDDDVEARRYLLADDVLSEAGLEWYEISSWALPGHECRHNQLYWLGGQYKGIGCGAHSYLEARRSWNTASLTRYIDAVAGGRSPTAGSEVLEGPEQDLELAALALRTRSGIPADLLEDDPALEGLVDRRDGRAVLTRAGRLLANEVTLRLRAPRTAKPARRREPDCGPTQQDDTKRIQSATLSGHG